METQTALQHLDVPFFVSLDNLLDLAFFTMLSLSLHQAVTELTDTSFNDAASVVGHTLPTFEPSSARRSLSLSTSRIT